MYKNNYYIWNKYNDYLEWFENERDKDNDYETQPLSFEEFEDEYMDRNEDY